MPTTPDRAYSRALLARQPLQWFLTTREESGSSTRRPFKDNAAEGANDNAAEGADDDDVAEGAYDAKGASRSSL